MRRSDGRFLHLMLAVAAVTALSALASCGSEDVADTHAPSVRPVKLVVIEDADSQRANRYPAVIDATEMSELSFEAGGLLSALPVKDAMNVEKGALIARLDSGDFRSSVAQAEAQFGNADTVYQRAVRLAREDAIALSVLEERRSQRDVANARLDSARKALSDATLLAPFSGVIANVPVTRLQHVQAGQLIAVLMSKGALKATINVPARVIAQLKTRIRQGMSVILDAAPEIRIPAVFEEASLVADTKSQTYAVTLTFEPPDHLIILPGMTATVEVLSAPKKARGGKRRVAVPLAAVMSDGKARYVWVVKTKTMTVTRRSVTIEDGIGATVIVTDGLKSGETIAGAGAAYLAEGMKVRPWTPS